MASPKTAEATARRKSALDSTRIEAVKSFIPEKELRDIFHQFDYDGSGSIDERELHQAMKMLGVTCSLNTAQRVLKQIDSNSNGLVEWDEFQAFFAKVGDPDDIKEMLSLQSQKFFEYKKAVDTDTSFAKTFLMPPSVAHARRFDGHNDSVEKVAWNSSDTIISGSIDGEICFWNPADADKRPKPKGKIKVAGNAAMYTMAVSTDGTMIAAGLDRKPDLPSMRILSVETTSEVMALGGHDSAVYACDFSHDRALIASGGKNGVLCIHDVMACAPQQKCEAHMTVVHDVSFCGMTHQICSASKDGSIKVYDVRNEMTKETPSCIIDDAAASGTVLQARWRSELEILSCGDDYCIKRWDLRKLADGPVSSYFGHTDVVRALAIAKDGKYLASGTHSGSVRVWYVDTLGMLQSETELHEVNLGGLKYALEAAQDEFNAGNIDVNELKDAKRRLDECQEAYEESDKKYKQCKLQGYSQASVGCDGMRLPISALAWAPDARSLAVGCQDQSTRVYEFGEKNLKPVL